MIEATLYTDAGCPWAYSANPALRVLEWRFREQLRWRLVMIGLREEASEAAVRAYDPDRALARWRVYEERYGMPFATEAKARPSGTGRGCRAVVAAGNARSGKRVDGVPRAPDCELHVADALSRRRGEHPRGASRGARCRRGRHRRAHRRRRRRRRVRAPAGRGALGGGHSGGGAGQDGDVGRAGAVHGAVRRVPSRTRTARSPAAGSRSSPTTRFSRTSLPSSSASRRPSRPSRSSSSSRPG